LTQIVRPVHRIATRSYRWLVDSYDRSKSADGV
jgi:hypothetical protein